MGSSAVALHREMLAQGVDSSLYSTYGEAPVKPAQATFEFKRLKPDFLYYAPTMHRRAASVVQDSNVLHGHGLYVGTNFIFGTQARRQNKSLVYHVHGMFEPFIINRSRWKKNLVRRLFEDANIKHVRLWRALTVAEADQIRALVPKAAIVVAPNGLKLGDYPKPVNGPAPIQTPLIPNFIKTKKRILFLGRIHPKKGLDLLVRAWANLEAIRKDWELVIAGPDELNHRSQIQKLAASLGIEREVVFTGTVTGSAKTALIYSSDIFVLTSYSEGLPMTLLEAMACEVPIVATQACNCPDAFAAGAGWGCDPTANSVTETLQTVMQTTESERKQRGQQGRQLVQRAYSWDQISKTILEACSKHC